MASSYAVGIDLGTTTCALARFDAAGRTAMIRNPLGDQIVAGVVFFEDDELLFGRAANQAASTQPQRAAECFKRDFGQSSYTRAINGELLPVELIEACLLKNACDDLPTAGDARPAVALALPAAFDQAQRRGVVDAARIAGVDLLGTISEPLATALAFAEVQGYLTADAQQKPGCRVLVFDLGGGKLDAAIVEIKHDRLRTLAVIGDPQLGGRDWDQQLAEYLAAKFEKEFGDDPRYDMVSVRRLVAGAEEAKHTLTARQQARVHIERTGYATDIAVQRHAFEEATTELVDRARRVAEDAIAQAGLAWRDIAHLLLVGGATRMPMIGAMIESVTGLKPATNMHAEEAVARGAALYAEQLLAARENRASPVRMQIIEMTAHSMGIRWQEPGTDRAENVVLIPRGTEMPCGTSSKVVTEVDDQRSVSLQLLEGESRNAEECRPVAQVTIDGLPDELPRQSSIDVFYQISAEGRLQVKAQLKKGGHPLTTRIERAGGLTDNEIADWNQLLQTSPGLKAIHALVAKHTAARPPDDPPPEPTSETRAPAFAPPQPRDSDSSDDFQLDVTPSEAPERRASAGSGARKVAILLTGYVISSVLGLAIGYYILMVLRPEWNVLNLRLPGVRTGAASDGAASPDTDSSQGPDSEVSQPSQ